MIPDESSKISQNYPLVMTNIAMVAMAHLFIDGLPINSMVIFHRTVK